MQLEGEVSITGNWESLPVGNIKNGVSLPGGQHEERGIIAHRAMIPHLVGNNTPAKTFKVVHTFS